MLEGIKSAKKYLRNFIGKYIGVTPLYSRNGEQGEVIVWVEKKHVRLWLATENKTNREEFPIGSFISMRETEKEYLFSKSVLDRKFIKDSAGFKFILARGGYPKIIFSEAASKEDKPTLLVAFGWTSEEYGLASLYNSQKKELHEAAIRNFEEKSRKQVLRLRSA